MKVLGKIINFWEGEIKGELLVTQKKISFLGDVDPKTGRIIDKNSDIYGLSIKNKIFVFRSGRGSTVGASVLFGLAKRNLAPKILICVEIDPVVLSGAIFGDIPMLAEIDKKALFELKSGKIGRVKKISNRQGVLEVD
ncbi:MAG: aconitase X swivel domain-containing protein [Candidatus Njordarchaeales archaeon]